MQRDARAHAAPTDEAKRFAAGLRDEKAALTAFIALLESEQEALVNGDADRVAQLATEKADRIELLAQLGESRNKHLAAHKLNANAEGMRAWLNRNPELAGAVKTVWRELLAQAEKAQQINRQIGSLIATRLQHNRARLAALQVAASPNSIYRPDGQLRPWRNVGHLSLG